MHMHEPKNHVIIPAPMAVSPGVKAEIQDCKRPSGYSSSCPISSNVSNCHDHSSQLFAFNDSLRSIGHGGTPAIVFSLIEGLLPRSDNGWGTAFHQCE